MPRVRPSMWGVAVCLAATGALVCAPSRSTEVITGTVIRVVVDSVRPFERTIYGFNTESMNGFYSPGDSAAVQLLDRLRPASLRFPGGTPSNSYHWKSGRFDSSSTTTGREETNARQAGNLRRLESRQKGVVSFDEFMQVCRRFKIRPTLVVNVLTGSPKESEAWVRYVKSQGFAVAGWELGNELYTETNRNRIPEPRVYLELARAHAAAMRAADSSVRLAIVGSIAGFHPEAADAEYGRRWDEEMATGRFFDAVAIHFYAYDRAKRLPSFETMRQYLFGVSTFGLDEGLDYYKKVYGPRPDFWITEWGLANPENQAGNRHLQAMYVADLLFGLVPHSRVRIAQYHMFAGGPNGAFQVMARMPLRGGAEKDVYRAPYGAFRLLAPVWESASQMAPVRLSQTPRMTSVFEYEGRQLSGVRAIALRDVRHWYILVTNRTAAPVPFTVQLGDHAVGGAVLMRYVAAASLEAAAPEVAGDTLPGGVPRITEWRGSAGSLVLPPNAIATVTIAAP